MARLCHSGAAGAGSRGRNEAAESCCQTVVSSLQCPVPVSKRNVSPPWSKRGRESGQTWGRATNQNGQERSSTLDARRETWLQTATDRSMFCSVFSRQESLGGGSGGGVGLVFQASCAVGGADDDGSSPCPFAAGPICSSCSCCVGLAPHPQRPPKNRSSGRRPMLPPGGGVSFDARRVDAKPWTAVHP